MPGGVWASAKQQTIDSFESFFRSSEVPRWPLEVFLEVSTVCNLRCAMCSPFSAVDSERLVALSEQPRGFFDFEAHLSSLEPVLKHALFVHAFGYGEPTVNPQFLDLLDWLSGFEVMIDFITNGMRLTADVCDAIVRGGVANVVVSISGTTRSEDENVYQGGNFETVLAGLKRLDDARKSAGRRYPKITVNSIAFRHHIESLPEFVDLMAAHGVDIIEVKKLMDDVPVMADHAAPYRQDAEGRLVAEARARADRQGVRFSAEQYERESDAGGASPPAIPVSALKEYARALSPARPVAGRRQRQIDALASDGDLAEVLGLVPLDNEHFGVDSGFFCLEPFKTMYVRQNGFVKPCCFAADRAPALGSTRSATAAEIWSGGAYNAVRRGIETGLYPHQACEWCIRRGSGPKRNVIRERIRDYADWFAELHGIRLAASPLPDVAPEKFGQEIDDREPVFGPTPGPPEVSAGGSPNPSERATSGNGAPALSSALRRALRDNQALSGAGALVDVVIPIHNAGADARACVESVARRTSVPFRLILVNDGSTDPAVAELLTEIDGAAAGIVVINRAESLGFVRTVNEGFALSSTNDVVILNSDTVVSSSWLERLTAVARSRDNVATVTPLTNNGTLCSVPCAFQENELPDGYGIEELARLIAETSLELFPEAPTGVGFCMLITRRAIETVGTFDADTFGRGYGEENDFCRRAIGAGLVNLIADNAFVYHKGRASFGPGSQELLSKNLEAVVERHPRYPAEVEAYAREHPLRHFHAYLRANIAAGRARHAGRLVRVLHVLHSGGGTEKHARELAETDDPTLLNFVSTSDGPALTVDEHYAGRCVRTARFPLRAPVAGHRPFRDAASRDVFSTICEVFDVDVIHVHHLMHNTFDIADVARERGIPYMMSLHDYHTICPSYTLLDAEGRSCAGCTEQHSPSAAQACMHRIGYDATYLATYQRGMRAFLSGASELFVPNVVARDLMTSRYPELRERIRVLEHGHRRLLAQPSPTFEQRQTSARPMLHVATIGGLDIHKGSVVFRSLLRANSRQDVTFHLYGTTTDQELKLGDPNSVRSIDGSRYVYHGPYNARAIVDTLRNDGIHVGLHLSIWPETFSYTLSEFAEARIPVIAGRLGAQGERVERCSLGWTVDDVRNPHNILAILDEIGRDPSCLARKASEMKIDAALPPMETMWAAFGEVYRGCAPDKQRDFEKPPASVRSRRTVYAEHLAMCLADASGRQEGGEESGLRNELETLHQRLRSPRHRIAEALGDALQRVPILWPIVSTITERVLRRQARRVEPRT